MKKIDLKVLEELKSFSPYRKTDIILSSKYQKKCLKRALEASEELFQSFLNEL